MHPEDEKEILTLRRLLENGVAKRYNLLEWCTNKHCENANAFERTRMIFEQIRPEVSRLFAWEESLSLAQKRKQSGDNFVYGEIVLEEFYDFLCRYAKNLAPGTPSSRSFYDLGSGTGKSVLVAALCPEFQHARGCEIIECLHGIATTIVDDFREIVQPALPLQMGEKSMSVRHGDFFEEEALREWTTCDFVWCNCLTWDEDRMERLAKAAERMPLNAVFVTVLLPLPSAAFEVVAEEELNFSWGSPAPVLVHVKRRQLEESLVESFLKI